MGCEGSFMGSNVVNLFEQKCHRPELGSENASGLGSVKNIYYGLEWADGKICLGTVGRVALSGLVGKLHFSYTKTCHPDGKPFARPTSHG